MDSTRPYRASATIRKAANSNRMPKRLIFKKFFLASCAIALLLLLAISLLR